MLPPGGVFSEALEFLIRVEPWRWDEVGHVEGCLNRDWSCLGRQSFFVISRTDCWLSRPLWRRILLRFSSRKCLMSTYSVHMGSVCRPRNFQTDQAVETQTGKTMSCETDETPQVVSHELPNGHVFERALLNILRDSKYIVFQFRPWDDQAVEAVAGLSVSSEEGKTSSRHVIMREWKVAFTEWQVTRSWALLYKQWRPLESFQAEGWYDPSHTLRDQSGDDVRMVYSKKEKEMRAGRRLEGSSYRG